MTLTRTAVYLQNKANRIKKTWEDTDSLRVDEILEASSELPPESQRAIRPEDFVPYPSKLRLHRCPFKDMPTPVETEEVRAAYALLEGMFTSEHTPEDRYPMTYKKARTE